MLAEFLPVSACGAVKAVARGVELGVQNLQQVISDPEFLVKFEIEAFR